MVTDAAHELDVDDEALRRLLAEQSALRRVATLVAGGARAESLAVAVAREVGLLFDADASNMLRWDGDTLRVIGDWSRHGDRRSQVGSAWVYGGDTITARVIETGAPARIDSADDLATDFGRRRWRELGLQASIGAPIVLERRVWGIISASRVRKGDVFDLGAETRLADFAALVATAIANGEARAELASLASEQAALRHVATLVAGGKPQAEVLQAVAVEAARVHDAEAVHLVRWEGVQDEVTIVAGWVARLQHPLEPGARYHPSPGSATLRVLETGLPGRTEEDSPELGRRSVIAAPVIVNAELLGAIAAFRPTERPFEPGSEIRLRSFGDLAAQAVANERAQAALRASRARIVRAADDERRKLERNLHDGAQQRLVAVLIQLRLAASQLATEPERAHGLLLRATEELTHAIDELRELARGIHPAVLTERGLSAALELLTQRSPLRIALRDDLARRLPPAVEAAAYYVVAESLANVGKHAPDAAVEVRLECDDGRARVAVADDGPGGADLAHGTGLRGLADRVEALDGAFAVESAPGAGTRVVAEIPVPPADADG